MLTNIVLANFQSYTFILVVLAFHELSINEITFCPTHFID